MKQSALVFVVAAASAFGAAFITNFLVSDHPAAADSTDDAEATRKLASLERTVAELTSTVQKMRNDPGALASPMHVDESAIDRAARQLIEERAAEIGAGRGPGGAKGATDAAAPGEELDVAATVAELVAPGKTRDQKEALLKRLAQAGKIDEAIEMIEGQAELQPNNPNLRVDLGNAYLQKLFTVPDDQKGEPAMASDAAYDAALKIDPNHWEARFTKAISLSFWPPIAGKMPEAVSQFETLIGQQEQRGDRKPEYAQSYLFLGNLYQQQGKADKAKEIWGKGAALFPDSAELKGHAGG